MAKLRLSKLTKLSIALALIGISAGAIASDFNIPFYNAANLGDLYSGWAASAEDASTEYANPAGLIRIPNQQIVFAGIGIFGNSHFTGTTTPPFTGQTGTASDITHAFVPSFYYALPINNRVVFGFGETIPFAVSANYNKNSVVRYSTVNPYIVDMAIGPSVGIKINDQLSAGLGVDANRLSLAFNNMLGPPFSIPDAASQNYFTGWGYGWRGGLLYQFTPETRVGANYYSPVSIHTTGTSTFYGPGGAFGGVFRATNSYVNLALPARAELSAHHDFNQRLTVNGTIFYTNWGSLSQITIRNLLVTGGAPITAVTPLNYHNTFDYSVGMDYKATEKWLLRSGIELWQTPTNSQDRLVADPYGNATILGVGAHYQQNHYLGYDVGYAHAFFRQLNYRNVNPATGVTVFGNSRSNSNVVGAQVTWNLT